MDDIVERVFAICRNHYSGQAKPGFFVIGGGEHLAGFLVMDHAIVAMVELAFGLFKAPSDRTLGCRVQIYSTQHDPHIREFDETRHHVLPDLVLKRRFDHDRDLGRQMLLHQAEKNIGDKPVGLRCKRVVRNTEGIHVPFLDLIAAHQRHPQPAGQLRR